MPARTRARIAAVGGKRAFATAGSPRSRRRRPGAQARCAERQLPHPMAEADAVALFVYASVGEHYRGEASAELFVRLLVGGRRRPSRWLEES